MTFKEFLLGHKEQEVKEVKENKSDEILIAYVTNMFREKKIELKKIDDSEIVFNIVKKDEEKKE